MAWCRVEPRFPRGQPQDHVATKQRLCCSLRESSAKRRGKWREFAHAGPTPWALRIRTHAPSKGTPIASFSECQEVPHSPSFDAALLGEIPRSVVYPRDSPRTDEGPPSKENDMKPAALAKTPTPSRPSSRTRERSLRRSRTRVPFISDDKGDEKEPNKPTPHEPPQNPRGVPPQQPPHPTPHGPPHNPYDRPRPSPD